MTRIGLGLEEFGWVETTPGCWTHPMFSAVAKAIAENKVHETIYARPKSSEPMRFSSFETVIPNKQMVTHMGIIEMESFLSDIPVLELCQNLLVRSYSSPTENHQLTKGKHQ